MYKDDTTNVNDTQHVEDTMIDTKELRKLAQAATPGPDGVSLSWINLLQDFQQGASPTAIIELLDRLEAAEADALEQARLHGMGASREAALMAKLEATERKAEMLHRLLDAHRKDHAVIQEQNSRLRAKIEAMEKQEPAMWANSSNILSAKINRERRGAGDQHTCSETKTAYHDAPLYALPGAKGE
jgi:hypothetical protein